MYYAGIVVLDPSTYVYASSNLDPGGLLLLAHQRLSLIEVKNVQLYGEV